MAEKFPPIENLDISDDAPEGNFLDREKALVGDSFVTEQDGEFVAEEDEFNDFQTQFPDIDQTNEASTTSINEAKSFVPDFTESNEESRPTSADDSEPVKEWQQKREKDIEAKDKVSELRHEETLEEARKLIDQFYENYNSKKDIGISKVRDEEKDFIAKRDDFFKNDLSVWDRTIKLLDLKKSAATLEHGRDKTRFKELLLSLKNRSDVPGAGGY